MSLKRAKSSLGARSTAFDDYCLFESRFFVRLPKNYPIPVSPLEDKELRLTDHMSLTRTSFNALGRLYAGKKWRELANELANLQRAARDAEWVVNEILFPKLEVTSEEEEATQTKDAEVLNGQM